VEGPPEAVDVAAEPPPVPEPPPPVEAGPGPHTDLAGLKQTMRDAGVEEMVEGLLEIFRRDAPAWLAQLEAAVRAGNALEVARIAHSYRSAASQVTALGLAERLQVVENVAGQGQAAPLRALVAGVRTMHLAVMEELG
jgi:HPt (histidine-containing phosphotransfer) domain-containing protein